MAITTLDGLIGSSKQFVSISKTAVNSVGTRTTVASSWFTMLDLAGNPGAGVLAGTSTTTGVVPTDATAGCPPLNTFDAGATGYLMQVVCGGNVPCRIMLFDLLWKGGAYAFNANTSGNTPASYSSRVPNGTDFNGTEIWLEQVTAGTGVQSVNVTYTNELGTTGRSTGTIVTAANTVGRMHKLPLQAGDNGVQGVTGVVGTVATVGTFNILVVRPLWAGRIRQGNDGMMCNLEYTGMPRVYDTSALFIACAADSTTSPVMEMEFTIANG